MRRIVLVTSGQPSLNPRLVKEADALSSAGYNVIVIYQYRNKWGTEMDKALLSKKPWKAIRVGGSPNNERLIYWYSRLIYKKNQFLSKCFPNKNILSDFLFSRCTNLLLNEAVKYHADLYIAHNLGALPAAVFAAKKNNAKYGFDAEDFHRQEVTDDINSKDYQLVKFIEDKYLTGVDHLTASSPLIATAYQNIYNNLNPLVIKNVFSSNFLQKKNQSPQSKELKLFWFSQTIGKNRGIEDAIKAIGVLKKNISLTLLGNINEINQAYFLNLANDLELEQDQLNFISPIAPDKIFELASKYDIGLASEPGFCVNNDIALSNKIFTYLISGLAIIASNTKAQKLFIEENPLIGKLYESSNVGQLVSILEHFSNNIDYVNDFKKNAYQLAKTKYNWEKESEILVNSIKRLLQN
ncbi:hypothetical protein [Pedobacter frigiditerrae]|uniref:hypothetical protein n=1 Tax=Pedobacter frigiditerrae TaxID=2530452 RepID=UPI00292F25A8|nr:hypothetical protein [Pedobacter frigiditerrae]